MSQYKLREGENIRKPIVKRDRIEIHIPILLICLVLAFLAWLYVVSISKINSDQPPVDTAPVTEAETGGAFDTEHSETASLPAPMSADLWTSAGQTAYHTV